MRILLTMIKFSAETQDLEPVYMSIGAFFISRAKDIIKTGRRLPSDVSISN